MSNGNDNAETCCIIGVCCGGDDDHKRIHALASVLKQELGTPGPYTSQEVAAALIAHWDLVPKSWGLRDLLLKTAKLARTFPYVG